MCTVVFIPQKDSLYFASLRDENTARQRAFPPRIFYTGVNKYVAPVDTMSGGTWAGVNENGNVIVLLNGGFENHQKKERYATSRGLVVKELLTDTMPVIGWSLMDFANIEPFTLIVWADEKLFQLVWDGQHKHRILLQQNNTHIFSSATLYNIGARDNRTVLFNNWMAKKAVVSPLSLLDFFMAGNDKENGFIINRHEQIKTLSYTFIQVKKNDVASIRYHDFVTGLHKNSTLSLSVKKPVCLCH